MMDENRMAVPEEIRQAEGSAADSEAQTQETELDRRIQEALDAAREQWSRETREQVERARTEADALARMSGEERMAHELAQREAQLDAREREIQRRELQADAARMIEERGLPRELAGVVDVSSPERMQTSLNAVERAFRTAVQQGVEARMRGGTPTAGHREANASVSDEDYYRARYASGRTE